jgi:hypothetical protein
MELLLLIAVVVVGTLALLFLSRDSREEDRLDADLRAAKRDPDRQFQRPPDEGDLL